MARPVKTERNRAIVSAVLNDGRSQRSVAESFGLSEAYVKSVLKRYRERKANGGGGEFGFDEKDRPRTWHKKKGCAKCGGIHGFHREWCSNDRTTDAVSA